MANIPGQLAIVKGPSTPDSYACADVRQGVLNSASVRAHKLVYRRFKPELDRTILAVPAQSPKEDQVNRSTLLGLVAHALAHGWPTSIGRLLTGPFIDDYCATLPPGTAAMFRTRLDRIAAAVGNDPSATPRASFGRHHIRAPHTRAEKAGHYIAAQRLTVSRGRRHEALMVLDLTYGAGCSSASIRNATEAWVEVGRRGTWLHDPERRYPVPLAATVARRIRARLTDTPDRYLVHPDGAPGSRKIERIMQRMRDWSPSLTDFSASRAKSRWRVDVLDQTGFEVIGALLAGQPEHRTLLDLMPLTAPVSEAQAKVFARRAAIR